jgi:hypothetical protein
MSSMVHLRTTKLITAARHGWRAVNARHLVALARATFGNRRLVEQSDHQYAAAPATAA